MHRAIENLKIMNILLSSYLYLHSLCTLDSDELNNQILEGYADIRYQKISNIIYIFRVENTK